MHANRLNVSNPEKYDVAEHINQLPNCVLVSMASEPPCKFWNSFVFVVNFPSDHVSFFSINHLTLVI